MNSYLVPALVVFAVTAAVGIFFSDMFSGGTSDEVAGYAATRPLTDETADTVDDDVTQSVGSDFSWDESPTSTSETSLEEPEVSTVSTNQSDEAPGELYSSSDDSQSNYSFSPAAKNDPAADLGTTEDSMNLNLDSDRSDLDMKTASKQVDDDLSDFFNPSSKASEFDSTAGRSSIRKSVKGSQVKDDSITTSITQAEPKATQFVSQPTESKIPDAQNVDSADLQDFGASPNASDSDVDIFGFGNEVSDFNEAPRSKVNQNMMSVVTADANKKSNSSEIDAMLDTELDSVIPGSLQTVAGSEQPAMDDANSNVTVKTPVRKFKITNPKETSLPVTMSVDGNQITLKPDQSYVIKESDGDVEVTFSRGGSFGFEKKKLRKGHYRFSVSREAGWKLNN